MGSAHDWKGLSEVTDTQLSGIKSLSYEFSYADALEILRLADTAPNVRKLSLEIGELKIEIERGGASNAAPVNASPQPAQVQVPVASASSPTAASSPATSQRVAAPAEDTGVQSVRSPIAGIFYRASAPGEPPFVEVGSQVNEDTVVGIIEVMKVMNNIRAGRSGTISEICVENEELVQFDQTLFYLDAPSSGNPA